MSSFGKKQSIRQRSLYPNLQYTRHTHTDTRKHSRTHTRTQGTEQNLHYTGLFFSNIENLSNDTAGGTTVLFKPVSDSSAADSPQS